MISERAENDSAEGALKKDHSKYLHGKKRPPRLPRCARFCSGHKKNKIKNIVSASGKIAKRGVWLGKNEGLARLRRKKKLYFFLLKVSMTQNIAQQIYLHKPTGTSTFEEMMVDHLCDDSDDDDDDNWIEEWAVTIQSLFRGHYTRKKSND